MVVGVGACCGFTLFRGEAAHSSNLLNARHAMRLLPNRILRFPVGLGACMWVGNGLERSEPGVVGSSPTMAQMFDGLKPSPGLWIRTLVWEVIASVDDLSLAKLPGGSSSNIHSDF